MAASSTPDKQKDLIIDLVAPLMAREKYIKEYQKGGFTAVGVTIAVNDGYDKTIKTIDDWDRLLQIRKHELLLVRTIDDITKAYRDHKIGIIFHFQNANPLGGDIKRVYEYYKRGVRVMQLTYNGDSKFGSGCAVMTDTGLTAEGAKLVKKMNQVGMLIDVSHAGYQTAMDIIKLSQKPVVLSHSNVFALCPSERNVPDELIYAIAQSKGVIGLNALSCVVKKDVLQATLDQFLDHLDYIVQLVGVDSVSLGLDYYTGQWPYVSDEEAVRNYNLNIPKGVWNAKTYPKPPHKYADGIETPDKIRNLKPALQRRGYSEPDIAKIYGGNLMRVFADVWAKK